MRSKVFFFSFFQNTKGELVSNLGPLLLSAFLGPFLPLVAIDTLQVFGRPGGFGQKFEREPIFQGFQQSSYALPVLLKAQGLLEGLPIVVGPYALGQYSTIAHSIFTAEVPFQVLPPRFDYQVIWPNAVAPVTEVTDLLVTWPTVLVYSWSEIGCTPIEEMRRPLVTLYLVTLWI